MKTRNKTAPIVAELGRPETPEETAARKAENSRKHRANQTLRNLLYSLAASLAAMLFLVLVVVRPDQPPREPVDFVTVAQEAQNVVTEPLAHPALPPEWTSNKADLTTSSDGISTWYIGFITPGNQFIALSQGISANPTWVAALLENTASTGAERIDGVDWTIYDNRTGEDPGNLAYAMVAVVGESSYVLYGTADDTEFLTLATSLVSEMTPAP